MESTRWVLVAVVGAALLLHLIPVLLGMRVIPNNKIGIVEKLWSGGGSLPEGRQIALGGEAGFQSEVLRAECTSDTGCGSTECTRCG